jgi:signal transduction histidine kinase
VRYGLRACWAQPILSRDGRRVLGVISNYSRQGGEPSRQSLRLLAIAAHLAQVAIEADQLNSERLAVHEQLRSARVTAEKANRAKDRFLAVLSHELRTPLSPALLIAASMARDAKLPDEARENLSLIERSIHFQSRLINDLLDLSRIENNKLSLQLQVVDLHHLLQDCLRMCEADLKKKVIKVSVELQAGNYSMVGDPLRLHQIFCNLIKNAAKFTPIGGSLSIASSNTSPEWIRLVVQDNGIGATADVIARIFEPFEQAGRVGDSQGLGLGLTICKGLTQAHGGRISASSDGPNMGMKFTLEFPVTRQATPAPAHSPESAKGPQAPLRILLVEDHPETLRTLSELLQRLEHDVTTADSVGAALAAADRQDFDLIISDLGLPDGSGTGLMRELLKRKPLKGIALTGYGMESDIQKTREAGFFAHLTKPIDIDQLQQVIKIGGAQGRFGDVPFIQ